MDNKHKLVLAIELVGHRWTSLEICQRLARDLSEIAGDLSEVALDRDSVSPWKRCPVVTGIPALPAKYH
eukprot:936259-Amorphochlora_amoeboformis.AAC.1